MTQPIRVGIVDDHPVVREGLRTFLNASPDMTVALEAENGPQALSALAHSPCDVLLLDLVLDTAMDGMTLFDALRDRAPDLRLLVLTSDRDPDRLRYLEQHGALGYLDKTVEPDDLLVAIRQIAQGRRVWDHVPANGLTPLVNPLTPRELQVLALLAAGYSNKEIGDQLAIREKTVKVHVSHLLAKLGVYDRTQAVIAAHQRGLVRLR